MKLFPRSRQMLVINLWWVRAPTEGERGSKDVAGRSLNSRSVWGLNMDNLGEAKETAWGVLARQASPSQMPHGD
jgi:hypothetical protein